MSTKQNRFLLVPLALLVGAFATFGASGCKSKGPAEKAGEKVDEAANDTKRAIEDAAD